MDRPIIFSGPMVKAIHGSRKTMTRRILNPQPQEHPGMGCTRLRFLNRKGQVTGDAAVENANLFAPYYAGDRLWIREAFSYETLDVERNGFMPPWYWADGNPESGDFTRPKPSIHMPRWASRTTLVVKAVKIERLQDIGEADAIAEGMREPSLRDLGGDLAQAAWSERQVFQRLWDHLRGAEAWAANPFVAVITFETHIRNIDAMPVPAPQDQMESA